MKKIIILFFIGILVISLSVTVLADESEQSEGSAELGSAEVQDPEIIIPETDTLETGLDEEDETAPSEEVVDVDWSEDYEDQETGSQFADRAGIVVEPGATLHDLISWCVANAVDGTSVIDTYDMADYAVLREINEPLRFDYSYSSSYMSGQYYQNLLNLTLGDGDRNDIIAIATSQEGYCDGISTSTLSGETAYTNHANYSEYSRAYGVDQAPWNALFINWCARQAGISTSVIQSFSLTDPGILGPPLYDFSEIQAGDIVYIQNPSYQTGYRVGLVVSVDNDGTIHTIEGERGQYGKVQTDSYSISNTYLHSYFSPRYRNSWHKSGGYWYFINNQGSNTTGWLTRHGKKYYLDPNDNGKMQTGWKTINSHWYYFNADGVMQTGWVQYGEFWYYLGTDGIMQTGWLSYNGYTYYLSTAAATYGHMLTGWQKINNNWYHFSSIGRLEKGWIQPGTVWFYCDPETGIMQTGWLSYNGNWYYLSEEEATIGHMATGWWQIGGHWYYFSEIGRRQTGWLSYNGYQYYLSPSSNPAGQMTVGWLTVDGYKYYFNSIGRMLTGWQSIGGDWYYFNSAGKMQTGWVQPGQYWYYLGSDGKMRTGWLYYNGYTYYLHTESDMLGRMATGTVIINGISYTFDSNGHLIQP